MGVWGTGILSDDTTRDIYDSYIELFNRGNSVETIREKLLQKHAQDLKDPDEGPLIWIGIAKAQWACAQLEPLVLSKVREIVINGLGLDRWSDEGGPLLHRRKIALTQFFASLETPNPRPRKPRKAIKRKPVFAPGDCLAVHLEDGDWGAILILDGEPESHGPYEETVGKNLAAILRYKNSEMPTLDVFQKRDWLSLTHHAWQGQIALYYVMAVRFKPVRERFVKVGSIPLQDTDPRTSKSYTGWSGVLGQMYQQARWDSGIRD
jgi:hypothetical protein